MRALIVALLLMLTPISASATVQQEVATNNFGQPFIRLHNYYPVAVSCYYRDAYNYYTFIIPAQTTTVWQPIYGQYQWRCS